MRWSFEDGLVGGVCDLQRRGGVDILDTAEEKGTKAVPLWITTVLGRDTP